MDPLGYLMLNLRRSDVDELNECGRTPLDVYEHVRVFSKHACMFASMKSGNPACFVAFSELTPRSLQAAMLCTDEWPDVATQVYRWGVKICRPDLLQRGYLRAECRVMEGHDEAISFLEHLGFQPEIRLPAYGRNGRAFIQYAWRIGDHTHNGQVLSTPALGE